MKKLFLLTALGFSVIVCKKTATQENSLVGRWELTEYLAGHGEGGGTWQAANAGFPGYLEFRTDGNLLVSGYNVLPGRDRYLVESDTRILFIKGTDSIRATYSLSDKSLTINPPCLERCGMRYKTAD